MESPFPGMDPYLERHWEDVHPRLIGYIRDTLQPQLPEDLVARIKAKYFEDENQSSARMPDTGVVDPIGDPIRQRWVLIHDSSGDRIVTAIELLSPWNKSTRAAMNEYLDKRLHYVENKTNLVEIDLIRSGIWAEMIGPYQLPENAMKTYRASVVMPDVRELHHYRISIRAKLPTINVPLRPQDTPARLNLQELIEKAYTMGRYDRIDYGKPCSPPLAGPEKEWAEELIRQAPKR